MKKGTFFTLALIAIGAGTFAYMHDPTIVDKALDLLPLEKKVSKKGSSGKKKAKKQRAAKEELVFPMPETRPDVSDEQLLKETKWADPEAMEERLSAAIMKELKGVDAPAVQDFLKKPENRLALGQWALAHKINEASTASREKKREGIRSNIERRQKNLTDFKEQLEAAQGAEREYLTKRIKEEQTTIAEQEEEFTSPSSMRETLGVYTKAASLLNKLAEDPEWLERVLYTGECNQPGRMLAVLTAIAEGIPDLLDEERPLAIATAVALEWARINGDIRTAMDRARFFIDNDRKNRLHTGFRSLPFWQLRLLGGVKAENEHASVVGLRWALDNVHLPSDHYYDSCWQGNYLTENYFGDVIFGAEYYDVYTDVYGSNSLQRTRDIGGVCGSLSHYGACTALANGIPALPMGEPEHCSYVLMVNGKWSPSYSLSWDRVLHWGVWDGNAAFSSLHAASDQYDKHGKDEGKALADAAHSLGLLHAAKGDTQKALSLLRLATEQRPLDYIAWRDYANFLHENEPENAEAWRAINEGICKNFVPRYPEVAAFLLRTQVYPRAYKFPTKERGAMVSTFWQEVKELGPARWHIEAMCQDQLKLLQGGGDASAEIASKFYGMVLQRTINNPGYAPVILSWGNSLATRMGGDTPKVFLQATLKALSQGGGDGLNTADRDRMLGQALRGAASMCDRSSFQAIGKLLSEKYRNPSEKLPEWESFPGKLVSKGGLLRTSSTCNYDNPASHWGVLEPTGGGFHTGEDTNAYAVVELPKMAYITGVVTIAPQSNLGRLSGMKVQYSESGKDDDWHEAGPMPAADSQRINRLDLQGKTPRARFIRILRPGGPKFFHLNAIFVYGNPAA